MATGNLRLFLWQAEMDLFTLIGERGKSGKVIAKKLGTHLRSTEMLLNALVSLKLLSKSRGHIQQYICFQALFDER